ncbi:MAG: mycofactocin system transcriptional regulator [Actinomycetota bacterium]|nr:MAG: mycofactocin system transcriptional regulator [Actinomycetota bacterium]
MPRSTSRTAAKPPPVLVKADARPGRPPVTSRAELEHVALNLFWENGFDETTIDDIALACGIGRRTFFRYFSSKNDVPWGGFTEELDRLAADLAATPARVPLLDAIRKGILKFNRVDPQELPWHRKRMSLILKSDTLRAHSTLQYEHWVAVIAEYAAARLGHDPLGLVPRTIGYSALGACLVGYQTWLREPGSDLLELLDQALSLLLSGFADIEST